MSVSVLINFWQFYTFVTLSNSINPSNIIKMNQGYERTSNDYLSKQKDSQDINI